MMDGKSRWSIPTWYLFHGIAEKMDEQYYKENYFKVFQLFILICENIPCPMCRKEASTKIRKVNVHNINSKEKLKLFWFNFHNDVNIRLGKKLFSMEGMKKYEKIVIKKAMIWFDKNFFFNFKSYRIFTIPQQRNKLRIQLRREFNDLYKHLK
tara:strand:+ start:531 stop:989 length:459 start_codon:yes stop_codon:yes gene_type:complete